MKGEIRRVTAWFGPETGFEVKASPTAPFRSVQESRFEALKGRLLEATLKTASRPELSSALRRSANEAAELAWVTPYPLLVFPVLFEEKAEQARLPEKSAPQPHRRSRALVAI